MPKVIRLQNPNALSSPEFRAFLKRSVKRGALLGDDALVELLLTRMAVPTFAALVGVEAGKFKAITLVTLPETVSQSLPYVAHFYNEGSAALRDAVLKAMVDFIIQGGYTKFLAVNLADRDFKAWAKVFEKAGKATELGRLVEFEVG